MQTAGASLPRWPAPCDHAPPWDASDRTDGRRPRDSQHHVALGRNFYRSLAECVSRGFLLKNACVGPCRGGAGDDTLEFMMSGDAPTFRQAVRALHCPQSVGEQRAANEWLLAFAESPAAAEVCEIVLRSPSSLAEEHVSAAGVYARVEQAPVRLLDVVRSLSCKPAILILARAVATIATAHRAEAELLSSAGFAVLDRPRQLLLLEALAESVAHDASPEECALRPSTAAARPAVLDAVAVALLPPAAAADHYTSAEERAAALRCLTAWAACGVSWSALVDAKPALALALVASLEPCTLDGGGGTLQRGQVVHAACVAATLRACLQCELDTSSELEAPYYEPLLGVLARWGAPPGGSAPIAALGAPLVEDATGRVLHGGDLEAACGELACGLIGMGALMLSLLAEVTEDLLSPASTPPPVASPPPPSAPAAPTPPPAVTQLHSAYELLLASIAHPLPAAAEIAVDGWGELAVAVTCSSSSSAAAALANDLFERAAANTIQRSSLAQLRRGTGEDAADLDAWRERAAAPWLAACSERLPAERWLGALSSALLDALRLCEASGAHPAVCVATAPTPQLSSACESIEVLLFAASCTSCITVRAAATQPTTQALATRVEALSANAASWATGCSHLVPREHVERVLAQAAACERALCCSAAEQQQSTAG